MAYFIFFFSFLFFCQILGRLCDNKTEHEQQHFGDSFGRVMRQQINSLEQMPSNVQADQMAQKILQIRDIAQHLAQSIQRKEMLRLVDSLIFEHALKIGQFCENLLIGGKEISSEVIRRRMKTFFGIDQLKARVGQVQRLIDSNSIEWDIWPILLNFRQNKGHGGMVNQLVRQLGLKIEQIVHEIRTKNIYYEETAFLATLGQLAKMVKDKSENEAAKLDELFKLVPKLMVEATQQMLWNITMDTLKTNGAKFYGKNFVTALSEIVTRTERQCEELMRNSTVPNAQVMVHGLFNGLRNAANKMLEEQKVPTKVHFENIGKVLKRETEQFRIELVKCLKKHSPKRRKLIDGTSEIHKPFELLKEVGETFVTVQNTLDTVDLQYPIELVKEKLGKLEQLLKEEIVRNDAISFDDYEVHEEILNCLRIEEIEERIQFEIYIWEHQMMF